MNQAKKDITTDTPISIDNYTIKKAPKFDSSSPNKSSQQSSKNLTPPQQLSDNQEVNDINCLEKMYQELMNQSRYTEGSKLKKVIEQKRSQQKSRSILKIRREHKQQKKYVELGHRKQLRSLKNSWKNLNSSEESRKRQTLQQFNQFRQNNMKQYEQRVNRRCLSAKPKAIAVKIEALRMQQRALRKQGQSRLLRRIREEKSQLTKQYKRQYNESCIKIIEEQRRRMEEKEKQRYFAYLNIIERRQTCNRIKYKREQQRLKQKLVNVVRKLEHEQKIQISQLI